MIQVNCIKVHKYLGMKLDYTTVGQVKIIVLEYIDEIIDAFDKAYPTGGGTNSSYTSSIIFKAKNNAQQAVDFITWWQKYYLLPSAPG